MRISSRGLAERLLTQISTSQRRLFEIQERVTTGKVINRPSDDPFGASRVLEARDRLDLYNQYRRNILVAQTDLGVVETALSGVNSVLHRSLELAVRAGNTSVDAGSRAQIAEEVERLIEEALSIANTTHAGRRIFAGHQTGTSPFVPDVPGAPTVVNYVGDAGVIEREIGDGERLDVSVDANQVFSPLFTTLMQFRDNLRANDVAALQFDGSALTAEIDRVLQVTGGVGARMRRLDMAQHRIEDDEVRLREQIAGIEEADFAASLVELQMRDTALQAALGATGKSLNLSLLDFLR
jgi:flagellar hook-associated protein 3 FlgL